MPAPHRVGRANALDSPASASTSRYGVAPLGALRATARARAARQFISPYSARFVARCCSRVPGSRRRSTHRAGRCPKLERIGTRDPAGSAAAIRILRRHETQVWLAVRRASRSGSCSRRAHKCPIRRHCPSRRRTRSRSSSRPVVMLRSSKGAKPGRSRAGHPPPSAAGRPGVIGPRDPRIVDREGVIAVIDVDEHRGEAEFECVGGRPACPRTQRVLVVAVGVVAPEEGVATKAVAGVVLCDEAQRDATGRVDRAADHATGAPRAVVTCGRLATQLESGLRIAGTHTDDPGERIGAVGRALRAAQHLDLLDVEGRRRHRDTREIDVVDQEADRGIGRPLVLVEFADATQLEIAWPGGARRPVEVRHERHHILEMLQPCVDDGPLRQDRDARRQHVGGRIAQARSDDQHLVEILRARNRHR